MSKHKKNKKQFTTPTFDPKIGTATDEIVPAQYVLNIKNMIVNDKNHRELRISLQDAELARKIVNNAKLNNSQDCFLFFASLNLLNAYVKKEYASPEFRKNYFFKPLVSKGIQCILDNDIQNVRFSATKSLCMVNVEGLQFSYHCVFGGEKFNNSERNHIRDMWEGVRLQPYAKEVFEQAKTLANISQENAELVGNNTPTDTVDCAE